MEQTRAARFPDKYPINGASQRQAVNSTEFKSEERRAKGSEANCAVVDVRSRWLSDSGAVILRWIVPDFERCQYQTVLACFGSFCWTIFRYHAVKLAIAYPFIERLIVQKRRQAQALKFHFEHWQFEAQRHMIIPPFYPSDSIRSTCLHASRVMLEFRTSCCIYLQIYFQM